ncbi:MAG: thiamine pyrophosphate-dependent dehydrogenase E1 component subunit alpha [Actinobacteria bacterium]|nr:thiamine pyrophosphate-dependent dehydrogenase E1 component subunit alpha [Actinomycetota bacterium]
MTRQDLLKKLGNKKLTDMFERMFEIRTFEEKIQFLFLEGKMPGTIHQYIGMEACAVGVCSALKEGDIIGSTHRPHGHAIARGIPSREIMAELYGKTTGCCKGKGGSMHIGDIKKGMLPAIAIVGGNIPVVMGMALAFKLKGEDRVAVSFFGDGASNEGAFHEALNMASVYEVPAVFVCENNLYGASTSIKKVLKIENIADRASSYGMQGMIADGMDVLDVYDKASKVVGDARSGKGPTLLELKTFRYCGHSRRDPSNYIPKEEKQSWKKKDPILNFERVLLEEKIIDKSGIKELKDKIDKKIEEAIEFAQNGPEPKPEDTYSDFYVNMEVPR